MLTFLHHRQPPFQGSGSKKTPRAPARSPRKTAYSSRRNSSRMNTASCSWTEFPHKRNRVERGVLLCGLGMKHDGIKEIIGARLADSESKSSRSHRMENSRSEMSGARVPTRWPESENISPQVTRRRSFSSKTTQNPRPTSSIFIATLHHAPACGQGSLLNRNPAQEFEVGENLGCAQHHAAQRVVGDAYRQSGFFPDSLVQVLE